MDNLRVGSVSEYKSFNSEYEYTRWVCVVVAPDVKNTKITKSPIKFLKIYILISNQYFAKYSNN
ncbi:MAG: hypothetical protein EBT63_05865 [Proteobacteria bacterium]|nr:hypothetical protein [Pseudomonadota bacterium]NCA28248.1 hypothetical protein [Pseudomonadota bacterium]